MAPSTVLRRCVCCDATAGVCCGHAFAVEAAGAGQLLEHHLAMLLNSLAELQTVGVRVLAPTWFEQPPVLSVVQRQQEALEEQDIVDHEVH